MARPGDAQALPSAAEIAAPPTRRVAQADPDLEQELLRAERDFERGDYIELTVEQLEHCAATGESPWPDESRRRRDEVRSGSRVRASRERKKRVDPLPVRRGSRVRDDH